MRLKHIFKKLLEIVGGILLTVTLTGCMQNKVERVEVQSEKIELEVWSRNIREWEKNPWILGQIEEKYDVTFKIMPYPLEMREYINLQIASGNIPETIRDFPMSDYYSYIEQGILAEIPREMIEEHAPRLTEWFEREVGIDPDIAWRYYEKDGKNYSIPILWTLGRNGNVLGIRRDLFEAVGYSDMPTTLEELEEGMIKIKEVFDIYPLGGRLRELNFVFGAYDVYPLIFSENQAGKITYGIEEPNAKKALEVLNRWYELELIDPEFVINTGTMMEDKFKQGENAVLQYYWWAFAEKEIFGSDWGDRLRQKKPDAEIAILPLPKGPEGYYGTVQPGAIPSSGFQFGKQLEDEPEKMIKYLQVFDELAFSREMLDFQQLGIEGEHYQYGEENEIIWIPPYDEWHLRNQLGIGLDILPGCFNDYDLQAKYHTHPSFLEERQEIKELGTGRFDLLNMLYRPIWNQKSKQLKEMAEIGLIDFITGKRDLAQYDQFVSEWLDAGGREVLEEAELAYSALSK